MLLDGGVEGKSELGITLSPARPISSLNEHRPVCHLVGDLDRYDDNSVVVCAH